MSNRTLSIDDRLYAYLCEVSLDESELLRELREETAASVDLAVMQISPEQGQFMALLLKLMGAKTAIEIGTFTGYSSLCIAGALGEGGRLICCDNSAEWTQMARRYWRRAGLDSRIELRLDDAGKSLQALLDEGRQGRFDFIFIDADKQNYSLYYELSLKLLRKGGLMAIDNTLWSGTVANPENNEPDTLAIRRFNRQLKDDPRVSISLLPIGDGLTLALKETD